MSDLYHHGVKGMHWGIRRSPEQLGHRRQSRTRRSSKGIGKKVAVGVAVTAAVAVVGAVAIKNPKVRGLAANGLQAVKHAFKSEDKQEKLDRKKAMKDRRKIPMDELKERIARLEYEKKLKDLTMEDLYPGRKEANDVLMQIGKRVVGAAGAGAVLYGAKAVIANEFNRRELGNAVFNGGPKKK